MHLLAFLMTGACACRTMPPSASYGLSPSAEEIGPSPAPMRAAGVRPRSTPSSPPPSSTTSIHRLGSPTCWPACRIIPPSASTNFCLGIGVPRASPMLLERNPSSAEGDLTLGPSPDAYRPPAAANVLPVGAPGFHEMP